MVNIEFYNETKDVVKKYEIQANDILNNLGESISFEYPIELSVTFIDPKKSIKINNDYRNKNYIADVISFPTEMSDIEIKAIGFREVGDIFICLEEAKNKSIKYSHTMKEEFGFLITHGFLHLLGYDHEEIEDENIMFPIQESILKNNNINYKIELLTEE